MTHRKSATLTYHMSMDWARLELDLANNLSARTTKQTLIRLRLIDRSGGLDSEQAFTGFYLSQKRAGLSFATLNKYVQAITHYCHFMGLQWALPKYQKERAKRRQVYSDDEINQILDIGVMKREDYNTPMVLQLLAFTGARPSEICELTQSRIDYQNGGITIYATKTDKERYVPVPLDLIRKLSSLPDKLFTSTDKSIRDALKRRCEFLSIPYRPPYCLRHSRISGWTTSGVDLPTVSDLAGTSVNVIMEHYWHTSVAHLQNQIKRDTLRRSQMKPEEKIREIAKLLEEMKNSFKLDEDSDLDVELNQKGDEIVFKVKEKSPIAKKTK